MEQDTPEISDLVLAHDATGVRQPVQRAEVVAQLERQGHRGAAQVARRLPHDADGILDPREVDATLLRAHRELQRLNEEFQQPRRVIEVLRPMIAAIRASGRRVRVVDVGCGIGYVPRWLAARGALGDDVRVYGYDFNAALIGEAQRLAELEDIDATFVVGDAFELARHDDAGSATVFLSTGVLHHFRGEGLARFFAAQSSSPGTAAYFHWDIDPSWLAPIGAWIFHVARMREPLARYDGVTSALRAHSAEVLQDAARAPGFRVGVFRVGNKILPLTRTLRPVLGVRDALVPAFEAALGRRRRLLRWAT